MNGLPTLQHEPVGPSAGPPQGERRLWLRWVLPVVTFACGCLVGVGVTVTLTEWGVLNTMRRPGPDPQRIIAELKKELDLSPEQEQSVAKIVRAHDARMQQRHREMHPRLDADIKAFEAEMGAILNDAQRVKWQARCERMHSRFPPPPSHN